MSSSSNLKSVKTINVQYLLLVRHGCRDKAHDVRRDLTHLEYLNLEPQKRHGYSVADRAKEGWPLSQSLAGWVAEFLHLWDVKVSHVVSSKALDAQDTVRAYLTSFVPQGLCSKNVAIVTNDGLHTNFALHPEHPYSACQPLEELRICPNANEGQGAGRALMLCGHQPQLTWIANGWISKKGPIPLNLSEALLIRLTPHPELLWAVGFENAEEEARIRDKINSKFDTAKWFSGFVTIFLGIVVGVPQTLGKAEIVKDPTLYSVGMMLILGSLLLTLFSLLAYDTLKMPKIFWIEGPSRVQIRLPQFINRFIPGWRLERPPTPVHWILYSNMVRVWFLLFRPAVGFYFIGVTLVAFSAVHQVLWPIVMLGAVIVLALMLRFLAWQKLGSPD